MSADYARGALGDSDHQFIKGVLKLARECQIQPERMIGLCGVLANVIAMKEYKDDPGGQAAAGLVEAFNDGFASSHSPAPPAATR
jgi:hypothetical protein